MRWGGADQFDTINAREGLRDRARVASGAIVSQPAQHQAKPLFWKNLALKALAMANRAR